MQSLIIGILVVFAAVLLCDAFLAPKVALRSRALTALGMNADGVSKAMLMVRKKKTKEVEALLAEVQAEGVEHYITKYLSDRERPFLISEPIDFCFHTGSQASGTISVLPEYNKKSKTGFILGMPQPEIMGGVLRDAGSRAIIVSMDSRSGGCTPDEFRRFCVEQSRARLFMPSPVPIVWNDFIVDKVQISQAASLGGAAIFIYPEYSEDWPSFVSYAKDLGIEPIVCIDSIEQGNAAIAAGAKCIMMHQMDEKELLAAKEALPKDEKYMYMARLRPEVDFSSYGEIDLSWVLRDHGFKAVWPSTDAIFATGVSDIYPTILAMRSKAGRLFISPRQFLMDRKKEGAQEYLGDILY